MAERTGTPTLYQRFRYFDAVSLPTNRKTRLLSLENRSSGMEIGIIKWYPGWRQYCFFPHSLTVWSDGCLSDVQKLLTRLSSERARHG